MYPLKNWDSPHPPELQMERQDGTQLLEFPLQRDGSSVTSTIATPHTHFMCQGKVLLGYAV